jgi:hypothetical protein
MQGYTSIPYTRYPVASEVYFSCFCKTVIDALSSADHLQFLQD